MIELEVIESTDKDRIGNYKFHFNAISIGADINDNLLILDKDILPHHVEIIIEENKLYSIPQFNVENIHVNEKISTAKKTIKANDLITLGTTTIKILSFAYTQHISKKDFLNSQVQELPEKKPHLVNILQELTQ